MLRSVAECFGVWRSVSGCFRVFLSGFECFVSVPFKMFLTVS